MTTTEQSMQEAIANCDREPIHIPGSTQTFGALVALDPKCKRIEFASQTCEKYLGIQASELLGQSISALLDKHEAHRARNCLTHNSITEQREMLGEKDIVGHRVQMSIHAKDDRTVLEFLPLNSSNIGAVGALERTRTLLAESVVAKDYQTTLNAAVDSLRISTGFDRVKAYRFLPDGSGEVVAESRSSHTDSFLGLRFPATDIPPIARKLYVQTPIRVIADLDGEDLPIIGSVNDARPLDLSLAILRGTSEMHVQYLRNMGVGASMTLPIVVEGELWGLFSLHHMEPMIPDPNMIVAAELSGKMLSLIIQHTTQARQRKYLDKCSVVASELIDNDDSDLSVGKYWEDQKEQLARIIPSDGFAFVTDQQVQRSGDAPDVATCLEICTLAAAKNERVVTFDSLQAILPAMEHGDTGGALILQLSTASKISLVIFRNLAEVSIQWAGSPEKTVTKNHDGLQLNPRNSFTLYKESVKGKCDEWTNDDVEIATVLQSALARAMEIQTERRSSQQRLRLMVRELNHRVRNILTLVQSLSSSSKQSATSVEGYAEVLKQRIVALAGAHDLLTREDMKGIQLEKIASLELRPFLNHADNVATLSGPEVMLSPDVSSIIALVLHELTSNAVKYGALSEPGGKVELSWQSTDEGLNIHWLEKNGPRVQPPEREGFGRSIIENAIPYEFNGRSIISFEPSGVKADILLPLNEYEIVSDESIKVPESKQVDAESDITVSTLKCGLVVEDNYVIAGEARRWLQEIGFQKIVTVATVDGALAEIRGTDFDFCLLDVNLRGEMSEPIARELENMKIPYVFASGYGSESSLLCEQFDVPFLTKPFDINELRHVLQQQGLIK